jgi:serine/threonine protein kinase
MSGAEERLTAALSDCYRVERELGAGGMATVYLAQDLKHDRKVALKVLRPELAAIMGAERFLAEIRTTANLQHPHILPLFDSGQAEGFLFFVMPYVEGESLRDRLDREGELPVEEAVRIATAVASALDYAHRNGVIHRDIKPANILLHDGQPVVADFGIALAVSAAGGGRLTETGLSLGTPYYMSPEQATAERDPDPRSDVYALGCVLYEMLVGEPPYTGSSAQAVLGKILTTDPVRPTEHRKTIPAHVEAAVLKALEKRPADRFGSPVELARAVNDEAFQRRRRNAPEGARSAASERTQRFAGWGAAAVLAAVSAWLAIRPTPPERVIYANLALPDTAPMAFVGEAYFGVGQPAFALSPDGSSMVYVAQVEGTTRLHLRPGGGHGIRALEGTEGAYAPFFSPDGQWIGFFVSDQLKRVSITDHQVLTIAEANDPYGGSWGEDDRIAVVTLDGSGLGVVPATGGEIEPIVGDRSLPVAFPQWLPGGDWLLLECLMPQPHPCAVSSKTGEVRRFASGRQTSSGEGAGTPLMGSFPRYVPPGYLVFSTPADNVLMGVRFDLGQLRVTSEAVPLLGGIRREGYIGALQVTLSQSGDLAYAEGSDAMAGRLVWASGDGALDTLDLAPRVYGPLSLSVDGRELVVSVTSTAGRQELWFYDLENLDRGGRRWDGDLTARGYPRWDKDSRHVFARINDAPTTIVRIDPTSAVGGDTVLSGPDNWWLGRPTFDGRLPIIHPRDRDPGAWQVSLVPEEALEEWARHEDGVSVTVLEEAGQLNFPEVSPDGRWMTYTSSPSGPYEVFAAPLPEAGPSVKVSRDGGAEATWSARGDAFFFRSGRRFYRVGLKQEDGAPFTDPELFVEGDFLDVPGMEYATSPDGSRLLLLQGPPESTTRVINLVTNWGTVLEHVMREE